MASNERDLGAWILPQPIRYERYVAIPRIVQSNVVPFGYRIDDEDPSLLQPITKELDALELAKEYVKRYSYRNVAAWLSKETGRSISANGLRHRINTEIDARKRYKFYRALARKYKEALKKAKEYEERLGKTEKTEFFETGIYTEISRDWDAELQSEHTGGDAKRKHRFSAKSRATNGIFSSA